MNASTELSRTPATRKLLKLSLLVFATSLTACSSFKPVQAWEKGKLAKTEMKFDSDKLDAKFVAHTYFSKEAASGGSGVGAGGCGCN